jgi:hypothetical protein
MKFIGYQRISNQIIGQVMWFQLISYSWGIFNDFFLPCSGTLLGIFPFYFIVQQTYLSRKTLIMKHEHPFSMQ